MQSQPNMNPVTISSATAQDSRDIWSWRNDPLTRAMFTNTDEVSWESHDRWYKAALLNPNLFIYVGYVDGERIGMCRFDIHEKENLAVISMNLNPAYRGKNLSHLLMGGTIDAFRASQTIRVRAAVKKENIKTIKCVMKCGFVFNSEDNEYNYYFLNR